VELILASKLSVLLESCGIDFVETLKCNFCQNHGGSPSFNQIHHQSKHAPTLT